MSLTDEQRDAAVAALTTRLSEWEGLGAAVTALATRVKELSGPTIIYSAASVAEDDANGTTAAAAPSIDGGKSPFLFFLTDSAGGRFAVSQATGEITVADTSLIIFSNAESHDVEVAVQDENGASVSTILTIVILESQEALPLEMVFTDQVALREGDINGTVAGQALVSGGVGTVTLSLPVDTDSIFSLNTSTGDLSLGNATTFDTLVSGGQTAFTATIRATDSDSPTPTVEDLPVSIEGVPTTYDDVATHFQAVNSQYGVRTTALTNAVNSDELTIAFGFNKADMGSNRAIIWGSPGAGIISPIVVRFPTTNVMRIFAADTDGTTLLILESAALTDVDEWNFCLFSCRDGASKKDITFLINGTNALDKESANINGDIAIADATSWTYAAGNDGPDSSFWYFNGGLVDFMLAQVYVSSDSSFRDENGLLLNPGSDGSAALGSVPLLFFGGPDFDIGSPLNDHSGNANHFTPVGTLTVFEPGFNDPPEEPSGNVINAASLSKAHVTAAIDAATADGDIIQLPAGDAGYTTPLAISSQFKLHIRGDGFLGSDAAYRDAFTTLASLAEDVYAASLPGASGRAAAWAAYATARDAFQPTTTGLMFTLVGDDITLSRMEMDELTIQSVGWAVVHNRFTGSHSVDLESSHLGSGLLAQNILNRTTISITARVSSSASQSFWDNIAVTPGGTDMPCIQDNHVHANHTEEGVDRTCMDPSWQGGKALARRNVLTGGAGRALVRFHGPYRSGANCNQTNSGRYLELLDTLCINDTDQSWQAIEWLGGDGIIDNFRNGYKNGTFRIGIEANARPPACNAQCAGLSSANLNLFPYTQRTAGPSNGGEGLYVTNLFHKGSQITSMADAGTSKRCGNDLDDVVIEGTDYIFGARPGFVPLGTHPFESRIP